MEIPKFITHYHLADRQPFLTLSELEAGKDNDIFKSLQGRHKCDPSYKRRYGRDYIDMRQKIEDTLRHLFIARGGKPTKEYPLYFVLGQSNWFKGLIDEHREIRIDLDSLSPTTTSFTFPDSYVALSRNEKPYHGKVFLLHELESVVDKYGVPSDDASLDYQGYWKGDFEKYIEFQIWEDSVVQPFINEYFQQASSNITSSN